MGASLELPNHMPPNDLNEEQLDGLDAVAVADIVADAAPLVRERLRSWFKRRCIADLDYGYVWLLVQGDDSVLSSVLGPRLVREISRRGLRVPQVVGRNATPDEVFQEFFVDRAYKNGPPPIDLLRAAWVATGSVGGLMQLQAGQWVHHKHKSLYRRDATLHELWGWCCELGPKHDFVAICSGPARIHSVELASTAGYADAEDVAKALAAFAPFCHAALLSRARDTKQKVAEFLAQIVGRLARSLAVSCGKGFLLDDLEVLLAAGLRVHAGAERAAGVGIADHQHDVLDDLTASEQAPAEAVVCSEMTRRIRGLASDGLESLLIEAGLRGERITWSKIRTSDAWTGFTEHEFTTRRNRLRERLARFLESDNESA